MSVLPSPTISTSFEICYGTLTVYHTMIDEPFVNTLEKVMEIWKSSPEYHNVEPEQFKETWTWILQLPEKPQSIEDYHGDMRLIHFILDYLRCDTGLVHLLYFMERRVFYDQDSDYQDETLVWAVIHDRGDVVRLLSTLGVVDATAFNEAFRSAAYYGRLEIVKFLSTLPCVDPCSRNNYAINWAIRCGHLKVVQFLLKLPGIDPEFDIFKIIIR